MRVSPDEQRESAGTEQSRRGDEPDLQRRQSEIEQVNRQQQSHVTVAESAQTLGDEQTANVFLRRPCASEIHFNAPDPYVKSANADTLSAFVHTPTAPASAMRLSCNSMYPRPS